MRTPARFLALAVGSALLTSGCASALEVPIETPLKSKLDVSKFRRVLVAGFVTDLGLLENRFQFARHLRGL